LSRFATRNRSVTASPSAPPEVLRTPSAPPGIDTWMSASGRNPSVGVKVIVAPVSFQVPGEAGVIVGVGELVATVEENCTTICVVPETPVAPATGTSTPR